MWDPPVGDRLRLLLVPLAILCMGQDAGASDPCAAYDWVDVPATVGCNGPPPGAQDDNASGGACLADAVDPSLSGTCTTSPMCAGPASSAGVCVMACPAVADTTAATQTGGCPAGWRCWFTGFDFLCYPDCNDVSDCGTGRCNDQGRCLPLRAPTTDGGMPADAGAVPDAGTTDIDSGSSTDASVMTDAGGDAGDSTADAGGSGEDAGPTADAGPIDDAGPAPVDATITDAGEPPPAADGGCGCTIPTNDRTTTPATLLFSIALGALVRRRLRARRRQQSS